jgi:hypothetical protein
MELDEARSRLDEIEQPARNTVSLWARASNRAIGMGPQYTRLYRGMICSKPMV